jgi:hypothetical protein
MIQELDPGKYTAIEQAMIAWVRDSLLPQTIATEMVFKRKFFPDSKLYLKFNLAALARGDTAARAQFYKEGITWGWFTQNDVRDWEDLDPVDGGDTNWIGMNMMPLTMGGALVDQKRQQQGGGGGGGGGRDEDQEDDDDNQGRTRRIQPVIVVPVNVIGQSREIDAEAIGRQVAESVHDVFNPSLSRQEEKIDNVSIEIEKLNESSAKNNLFTVELVEVAREAEKARKLDAAQSKEDHKAIRSQTSPETARNNLEEFANSRRVDIQGAFGPVISSISKYITAKEIRAVHKAVERYKESTDKFVHWCGQFFSEHAEYVSDAIEPIVAGIESATGKPATVRPTDFALKYAEHQLRIAKGIPAGGADIDADYLIAILKATYLSMENSHAT